MAKTKTPSSVKLVCTDRQNFKFKASWTTHDYKDQQFAYKTFWKSNNGAGDSDWVNVPIGNKVNSKEFTVSRDYLDGSFAIDDTNTRTTGIKIRIRGRSKDKPWSEWKSSDTIAIKKPDIKSLAVAYNSVSTARFSWALADAKGTDLFYAYDYYIVTKTDYKSDSRPAFTQYPIHTISNAYVNVDLHNGPTLGHHVTVFLAVRARGPGGPGSWHYAHIVFGAPDEPTSWSCTASRYNVNVLNLTYKVNYNWHTYYSVWTKIKYQYCVTAPAVTKTVSGNNVSFAISQPSGASYSDFRELSDPSASGQINATSVGIDQVLFTRIELINNDDNTSRTTKDSKRPYLKSTNGGSVGDLSNPTYSSIIFNPDNNMVTVNASCNWAVPESFIAVYAAKVVNGNLSNQTAIGIIPHGTNDARSFLVPEEFRTGTVAFAIRSLVADYSPAQPNESAPTKYSIRTIHMASAMIWQEGIVPSSPELELVDASNSTDGARIDVSWGAWRVGMSKLVIDYTKVSDGWADKSSVTSIEIQASDYPNDHTLISGLDYADETFDGNYFFRAKYVTEGSEINGLYSAPISIALSATAPPKPEVRVDPSTVMADDEFSIYWVYSVGDKSTQKSAEVYEAFIDEFGNITYSNKPIATSTTEQRISLIPSEIEPTPWGPGETHYVALRTESSYSLWSDFSAPAAVQVSRDIQLSVTLGTGFNTVIDAETEESHVELTQIPFSLDVSNADGGTVIFYIEEVGNFEYDRPDDTSEVLFDQSVKFSKQIEINEETGEGSLLVDVNEMRTVLLNKRTYRISIINRNDANQVANYETDVTINWAHPSTIPSASFVFDDENDAVYITPSGTPESYHEDITDSGVLEGDYCDIYRYSPDGWSRIITNGIFGETYVDPHPTLGSFGGYRIVFVNKYNDDITADGDYAWETYEYPENYKFGKFETIIDFGNDSIHLPYNLSFSRSWNKDFTETKYLGGSVQGDWNPTISHTISVNTVVVLEEDSDTLLAMRRLAKYPGVCIVRTPDGTNMSANVTVKEDREEKWVNRLAKFSLDITRVDSESESGFLYVEP